MLVCSIPIKTFDINKDGRVLNQLPISFQHKIQHKRPIRNFNYLKMVMSNRSKEVKSDGVTQSIKSRTTSIQTCRKKISEFNPQVFLESIGGPNKFNKKKHKRTQSHQFQSADKKGYFMKDPMRGFPEGKIKKSNDPKWHTYCTMLAESPRTKGCAHYRAQTQRKDRSNFQSSEKPKTAPKRYIKAINIDQQDEEISESTYYKTIQYKSPRISMKKSYKEIEARGKTKNTPEISPWAVSLQNLEQEG